MFEDSSSPLAEGDGMFEDSSSPLAEGDGVFEDSSSPLAMGNGVFEDSSSPLAMGNGVFGDSPSPLAMGKGVFEDSSSPLAMGNGVFEDSSSPLAEGDGVFEDSSSPFGEGLGGTREYLGAVRRGLGGYSRIPRRPSARAWGVSANTSAPFGEGLGGTREYLGVVRRRQRGYRRIPRRRSARAWGVLANTSAPFGEGNGMFEDSSSPLADGSRGVLGRELQPSHLRKAGRAVVMPTLVPRVLAPLDYAIIVGYLALTFAVGVVLTRKASQSIAHFFVGGRGMSGVLLGVSMAATNFSIDTPVSISGFVGKEGIGGVWFFWASAISAMLVTFLFARLWRRSAVITDAEIIELRYGGKPASALRLFKGFYFGVLFNTFIMGWVFLAFSKVIGGVTDLDMDTVLWVSTLIVFLYTIASGFYGVVLTDFFQYFIALGGSILLAVFAVAEVGGLDALKTKLLADPRVAPGVLDFFPRFDEGSTLPLSLFLTYVGVQWWAHKYADGGGKHIQRMLAAKDESHAVGASLFFTFVNYALQVWPWILTALAAVVLFGPQADPEASYARMMAQVLPTGLLGLVVVSLVGAFMSTIDTHLNLGASYVINDMYKRFWVKDASDKHYVLMSRVAMGVLIVAAVFVSRFHTSVGGAWKFLLTFASGAGLTWIVRWFWWRANAYTEFAGMITSGIVATTLEVISPAGWGFEHHLLTTVALTTPVWLLVTYLTPPVDEETLVGFVRRIRPGSPGFAALCRRHGIEQRPFLGRAIAQWLVGLVSMFSVNFGLGLLLLGNPWVGLGLVAAGVALLGLLWRTVRADTRRAALEA